MVAYELVPVHRADLGVLLCVVGVPAHTLVFSSVARYRHFSNSKSPTSLYLAGWRGKLERQV